MPDFPRTVARLRAAGCVFAEDEARLLIAEAASAGDLETMLRRRTAGEPLEQVLGWVSFAGLRLAVAPGVFVPRQRTEYLVRLAVGLTPPGAVVVDLCCGCGALGAALAAAVPGVTLLAADLDRAAVACATGNLAGIGAVFAGDLFAALPGEFWGRVHTLMANVPYVPTDEIDWLPPEARDHEPRTALDGGPDGLDHLRRVAAGAPGWLAPGGHLLIEVAAAQADPAATAFTAAGLTTRIAQAADEPATIVIGRCKTKA